MAELLEVTADFAASYPDFCIQLGSRAIPIETGWHFGSRFPGDPATLAVFDFLPDVLLQKVANLSDFAAIYALDKWVGTPTPARWCSSGPSCANRATRNRPRRPASDSSPG